MGLWGIYILPSLCETLNDLIVYSISLENEITFFRFFHFWEEISWLQLNFLFILPFSIEHKLCFFLFSLNICHLNSTGRVIAIIYLVNSELSYWSFQMNYSSSCSNSMYFVSFKGEWSESRTLWLDFLLSDLSFSRCPMFVKGNIWWWGSFHKNLVGHSVGMYRSR